MADPAPNETLSAIPSAVASAVASAAATPASIASLPMDNEERAKSLMVSLADLSAKAAALYAQKKYDDATEIYAQAAEMQAELNGEMSPENADILFLYGRSVFKVGQSKSDVLGGKAGATAGDKKKSNGAAKKAKKQPVDEVKAEAATEDKPEEDRVAEEGVAIIAKQATGSDVKEGDELSDAKKPLFQFTGDENFEDSDEDADGEDAEGEGDEDEEEDDLATAFEVLDLSRVLFEKRLEELSTGATDGKGKEATEGEDPTIRHIKERLADTHDLLAEISLENERYPLAINDCRASLKYKTELYPEDSEIRAEAHFKLSLALEFASVTTTNEDNKDEGPKPMDQSLRDEAAAELEKAIASQKLKLQNKEVDLAMIHAPEENDTARKQIAELKEILAEMDQRLADLKKPPMDVNSVLAASDPMSGILGAALGESAADAEKRVEEAKKTANDLSGLVRKKPKTEPEVDTNGNGKRKAEEEPAESEAKKAKVEEAPADS